MLDLELGLLALHMSQSQLNAALSDIERRCNVVPGRNSFEGHHTIRIYNLLARADVFAEVPVHVRVLPIVEGVLDEGCLVSSLSSMRKRGFR